MTRQAEWALERRDKRTGARVGWLYVPTPKQVEFHETTRAVRRVLYGGQAGPGKSHALRWGLYRDCLTIPNLTCLLLRRTFKQLESTHLLAMEREQKILGSDYQSGNKIMKFPNGSLIQAGHCETTADAMNYLSTEYDRIAFDELVTFDRDPSLEIMSRARTSKPAVMAAGDAQVWAGTNPGGRGALWVKEFFIDRTVDRSEFPSYDPGRYGFVEAALDDNPYVSPEYRRDLEDLPEMRKRQLLHGDWNAFEGQFFSEWRAGVHIRDLVVGREVEHFAAMDWGYSAPGCVLWFACLPDNTLHVRWEYKFKGQSAESVALEIARINKTLGVKLRYLACDPAMKQKTGAGRGESIFETLLRRKLPMRASDNDRFNGWNRVHEWLRLSETADGQIVAGPYLTVSPECMYLIRTLPAMVQHDHDPEDIDTTKDDHACLVGSTQVLTAAGEKCIAELGLSDVVLTRDGWRAVRAVAMTADRASVLKAEFSDGRCIVGTANHPVFVAGKGFVPLDALRYGDILESCDRAWRQWSSTASPSDVIPTRRGSKIAAIPSPAGSTLSEAWSRFTAKCGSTRMARYLTAITSTIATATQATTRWITSNALTRLNTLDAMLTATTTQSTWLGFDPWQASGTDPLLVASGIHVMRDSHGATASHSASDATSVTVSISTSRDVAMRASALRSAKRRGVGRLASIMRRGSAKSAAPASRSTVTSPLAPARVSAPHVVAISPAGTAAVYNLTVHGSHEFFASGVLTHNCDALRYGLMSRPGPTRIPVDPTPPIGSIGWWKQHDQDAHRRGVLA